MANKGGKVVDRGLGYACHAAVMQDEALLGALPDPLDFTQGGLHLGLAPAQSVMGDTEAVRLVSYMLQKFEGLRIAIYEKRIGIAHPYHQLHALRKSYHGQLVSKAKLCQRLVCIRKLALPPSITTSCGRSSGFSTSILE